jgi:hypothetical protein
MHGVLYDTLWHFSFNTVLLHCPRTCSAYGAQTAVVRSCNSICTGVVCCRNTAHICDTPAGRFDSGCQFALMMCMCMHAESGFLSLVGCILVTAATAGTQHCVQLLVLCAVVA